ncbi:hypothetical protein PIB30_072914 [Stylosanthes scabra]|uniref:Putative plant transposon protein domain-containing protein n=1 Tax=Stylosanthes scabra TaxID=79078 RepID=A0ABU6SPB8_9FABA|nr:hypothetical protein [Stylosanthes scabra]
MASKGKAPTRAPSTRTRGSSSRQQPPLETQLYEAPEHAARAKILGDRKVIHECTIKFSEGIDDTFEEQILARGWDFMYEPSTPINVSWVSAHNKNELDMGEVRRVIGKEGATWWENPRVPIIPARPKKKILNNEAWMWMKLIVCNITPTRHETTLSMETVLLIYALMKNVPVSLPSIMNSTMNDDPTKSKNQLLPYAMFITKWDQKANVPRYPGDEILKIPKSQQFFPFEKWHGEDEEVAHPVSPAMPSPVPPPPAHTDIPTSSAFSSPEPSRKDLMRALRRNERIMRRHEQLMLMIHLGLDTSELEQISSPEVSQTQQEQGARSARKADAEEEEDFQSAEATAGANTNARGEFAEDD